MFWRVVKGLEVQRREVWDGTSSLHSGAGEPIKSQRNGMCFLLEITCLETAEEGSIKIQFPNERTSSVCFQANPMKSFLTLLLFYIPESFLEPAGSRDVDNLCQP